MWLTAPNSTPQEETSWESGWSWLCSVGLRAELCAGKGSWHALPAGRGQAATSKCPEPCRERGLPGEAAWLWDRSLGLWKENLSWASGTCCISKTASLSLACFWRRRPNCAYVLVQRADSSSVIQFSVCILFLCEHFSCFLYPLNSTTHILQHGDRQLPLPPPSLCFLGAFRNARLQIKSSDLPSAFLFSVLRMERALSVTQC